MTESPNGPDLTDLLNIGETIEYKGKLLKLRELTIAERGQFSTWLRGNALAGVLTGAAADAPDYLRAELQATYLKACAAGEYTFGGEASVRALLTPAGQAQAIYLMNSADPDVTPEFVTEALQAKYNELAPRIEELTRPKSAAPGG